MNDELSYVFFRYDRKSSQNVPTDSWRKTIICKYRECPNQTKNNDKSRMMVVCLWRGQYKVKNKNKIDD